MEWDNEFTDNGNIGAVAENLDNTQTWLRTLDQGQVTSSASSVNTSRRSSMDLDLSRGESVKSTKDIYKGYLYWMFNLYRVVIREGPKG